MVIMNMADCMISGSKKFLINSSLHVGKLRKSGSLGMVLPTWTCNRLSACFWIHDSGIIFDIYEAVEPGYSRVYLNVWIRHVEVSIHNI